MKYNFLILILKRITQLKLFQGECFSVVALQIGGQHDGFKRFLQATYHAVALIS